jgi:putative FmdB family regulatory protein
MPIYEFRCPKCELEFEVVQGMKEKHEAPCPECGNEETKRVFSIPGTRCITDAELQQRMMGVPKERISRTKDLIYDKAVRQKDANSEREEISNEYHISEKTRRK